MSQFKNGFKLGFGIATGICVGLLTFGIAAVTVGDDFKTDGIAEKQVVSAARILNNFTALRDSINNIPLGTYCGMTGNVFGNMSDNAADPGTGYPGAKALCEAACDNERAHMCTAHEISLSKQLGIPMSTTVGMKISKFGGTNGSGTLGDCRGWTSSNVADLHDAHSTGQAPLTSTCDAFAPVACCL